MRRFLGNKWFWRLIYGVEILAFLLVTIGPLFSSGSGSIAQRLQNDTAITTGIVESVGPSMVGNGPLVVLYAYNTRGPVTKEIQYLREQAIPEQHKSRFQPNMRVPVEYSRAIPGESKLQGYGTGSIYLQFQKEMLTNLLGITVIGLGIGLPLGTLIGPRLGRMIMSKIERYKNHHINPNPS